MSSFNALCRMAVLAAFVLAGCGFTPVYAPDGAAGDLRGAIAFAAPDTVEGFDLRGRLEDRLGRVQTRDYDLTVTLDITEVALAITSAQDINRYNVVGDAGWTLATPAGDTLLTGTVDTFTSYSANNTTVATLEAEQDARARLAVALADLIVSQLLLRASELP